MLGFSLVVLASAALATASPLESRAIDDTTYSNLKFYFQYAAASYQDTCAKPNGNTLVSTFNNTATDTQGFVVRDDTRKEIVVVFRGTSSQQDFNTDFDFQPVPYVSQGVSPPSNTTVHKGFLGAYNSVQSSIVSSVRSQLLTRPSYTIAITGHSLGAGIASVAAGAFKSQFLLKTIRVYTYGQPRTGNPTYAKWIDSLYGQNVFRFVHATDSVPRFVPQSLGFQHHGVEYWQNVEPPSAANVKKCTGQEDPTCSVSIPSTEFLNQDHLVYFGIFFVTTAYCS